MDVQLADVTVHIDENLDAERRVEIEGRLRSIEGVISVHNPDNRPHLTVIEFIPTKTSTGAILETVKAEGVHAELIGL